MVQQKYTTIEVLIEKVYSPELLQSLRDNAEYPDETELADGTPWMQ